jgi:hypothetical protein
VILRRLKSLLDQIDVALRGFDTRGRLLLKTVQNYLFKYTYLGIIVN